MGTLIIKRQVNGKEQAEVILNVEHVTGTMTRSMMLGHPVARALLIHAEHKGGGYPTTRILDLIDTD